MRKRKPCEWCADDILQSDSIGNHQLTLESYPENNLIAIYSYGNDNSGETTELSMTIEMNYCPVCGRKLNE